MGIDAEQWTKEAEPEQCGDEKKKKGIHKKSTKRI